MTDDDWEKDDSRAVGLLLHEATTFVLMAMNASDTDLDFTLPGGPGRGWSLAVDTARGIADPKGRRRVEGGSTELPARSLLLLETQRGE